MGRSTHSLGLSIELLDEGSLLSLRLLERRLHCRHLRLQRPQLLGIDPLVLGQDGLVAVLPALVILLEQLDVVRLGLDLGAEDLELLLERVERVEGGAKASVEVENLGGLLLVLVAERLVALAEELARVDALEELGVLSRRGGGLSRFLTFLQCERISQTVRSSVEDWTYLGESLAGLFQVASGKLVLLAESSSLLLAELELKIDNVLLAAKVADGVAELVDGAVVARSNLVDVVGPFSSFCRSRLSSEGRLRANGLEVLVQDGVLSLQVLESVEIQSQRCTRGRTTTTDLCSSSDTSRVNACFCLDQLSSDAARLAVATSAAVLCSPTSPRADSISFLIPINCLTSSACATSSFSYLSCASRAN